MAKFIKIMSIVFLIIAGTGILSSVWLAYYYIETKPNMPQPQQGRTYSFNVHGNIVYLDESENTLYKYLFGVTCVMTIGAIILHGKSKGAL